MISYKELGLVNTKEMFAKAVEGGYAIPAFNFNNMEQLQAIIMASAETKSPVILQVSKGARNYANQTLLRYMAEGAVEYAKELGWANPQIVLHLDHGDSFETCKSCVDMGFSSVMIDGKDTGQQTSERHQYIGCNHIEEIENLARPEAQYRCNDSYQSGESCAMFARDVVILLEVLGYNLVESDGRGECCQGNQQEESCRPQLRHRHILEYKRQGFEYKRRSLLRF